MNKLLRMLLDRNFRFSILAARGFYNWMPDRKFLEKKFLLSTGKKLDLDNPKTYNEKLQWLKLHDRRPEYTTMVDKYAVRGYIKDKIGEEYLIPLVGGPWKSFDEIDFNALPDQFVLKCTHNSGGLVICRDKRKLDMEAIRQKLTRSLNRNYYLSGREWPYKDVPPQIIAEKYMQDGEFEVLPVYKFFCFDGKPKLIQAIQNDKQPNESIDYFDTEWNRLELRQNFPNSETPYAKPEQLGEMLKLVEKLSSGMKHIRVDVYVINGKVMFSELTFYSDGGFAEFHPAQWDEKLGNWLEIRD